jgi:transcription antitermination protein NusB
MGKRRKAREVALQVLYLQEAQDFSIERATTTYFSNFNSGTEAEDGEPREAADADIKGFAEELASGVNHYKEKIDQVISDAALNWRVDRMTRVDRNVLRLAVYELLFEPEIPLRVTMNEAIELAKRFGTNESAAFVNGILDKIAQAEKPIKTKQ